MISNLLQVYFDKALWQCLLYKAERQQADMVSVELSG
jgi:hypothetical protein